MASDDQAARKARAERLRAEIAAKKRGTDAGASASPADQPASKPAEGESPREFVERRMRELREQEKGS
jgi:hypothetical protein